MLYQKENKFDKIKREMQKKKKEEEKLSKLITIQSWTSSKPNSEEQHSKPDQSKQRSISLSDLFSHNRDSRAKTNFTLRVEELGELGGDLGISSGSESWRVNPWLSEVDVDSLSSAISFTCFFRRQVGQFSCRRFSYFFVGWFCWIAGVCRRFSKRDLVWLWW